MRARTWMFLLVAGLNLIWALSTGGRIYWLFFLVMAMMFALALVSMLLARLTLTTSCMLPEPWVNRQSEVELLVDIAHRCPLPMAPMLLTILPPDSGPPIEARVSTSAFVRTRCRQRLYCPHVGTYLVGLSSVAISDVFSLFLVRVRPQDAQRALMVRPLADTEVRPLRFRPGETENAMMARATEDTSEPADTRAWQEGDPLKRVHWKLSMRKRELLVRTFEEPMRPDALVLVNCERIAGDAETAQVLRDVMCETAASVAATQLLEGRPVRLPLIGSRSRDISTDNPADLRHILDALAEEDFQTPRRGPDKDEGAGKRPARKRRNASDEAEEAFAWGASGAGGGLAGQRFELVMLMEMRRLRRTGATVIVSASITSNIADAAIQMRRMGPYTRFYLVHAEPLSEEQETLLNRLEKHDIEVETVALVNDYVQQEAG